MLAFLEFTGTVEFYVPEDSADTPIGRARMKALAEFLPRLNITAEKCTEIRQ